MIPQDDSWKKTWKPEGIKIKKGGRPKGKTELTLAKERVQHEIEQKILGMAEKLVNSQATVAQGCSFLYVVTTDKDGKRGKPELVTDKETIGAYLAGDLENAQGEFYYITTEKPDSRAVDSLLDRGIGKVKNTDVVPQLVQVNFYNNEQLASIAKRVLGKNSCPE